jgi:hypothetical protein
MKANKNHLRMSRRALAVMCVLLVLATVPGFASDRARDSSSNDNRGSANSNSSTSAGTANRDVDASDLKGITKKHHYWWAMGGGAAIGAGIGALLPPGSGKSATKGMLIGGSAASFFWLAGHRDAAEGWRPLAWIATNTILATGLGWTFCNCGTGAWTGALIGGGFTALVQAVEPRHHPTLTKYTGADQNQPMQNPPPQQQQQQQPPVNPPPQQQQPQSPPPNPPQANPPQTAPPPDQPPDAPEPKSDR